MGDAPKLATAGQKSQIAALVTEFLDGLSFEAVEEWIRNPSALRKMLSAALPGNHSMASSRLLDSSPLVAIEPGSLLRIDRSDSPGPIDFSVEAYTTRFIRIDRGRSLAGVPTVTNPGPRDVVETIDIGRVKRVLLLKPGETSITSYENLRRIKASQGKTLLDIQVMEELLRRPWLIPEEFATGYTTLFWGTILPDARGEPYVAGIQSKGGGAWGAEFHWLPHALHDCHFAACLEN